MPSDIQADIQRVSLQDSVARKNQVCYTICMIYTISKYIFMILLCIPILGLGAFLFDKLLIEVLDIQKDKRSKREERLAERRRKELFDQEYNRRHNGGYYH